MLVTQVQLNSAAEVLLSRGQLDAGSPDVATLVPLQVRADADDVLAANDAPLVAIVEIQVVEGVRLVERDVLSVLTNNPAGVERQVISRADHLLLDLLRGVRLSTRRERYGAAGRGGTSDRDCEHPLLLVGSHLSLIPLDKGSASAGELPAEGRTSKTLMQ